jgi:hypothetical protein
MLSLKIQNIQENAEELERRVRKSTALSASVKKNILKYIKTEDWYNVIRQLLSAFDGVTYDKILNYPGKTRIEITMALAQCTAYKFNEFCQKCYDKYFV